MRGRRKGGDEEKAEVTVYYTSDPAQQSQYISMFTAQGYKVAVPTIPSTQFITSAERVYEGLKFVRVTPTSRHWPAGPTKKVKIVKLFRKAAGTTS